MIEKTSLIGEKLKLGFRKNTSGLIGKNGYSLIHNQIKSVLGKLDNYKPQTISNKHDIKFA